MLFWAAQASAQEGERVCDPKDAGKCSQALEKGEEAPFSGQLLTPKLAIALAQKAERFDIELQIELEKDRALARIDLELQRRLRQLENASFERQKTEYENAIFQFSRWFRAPIVVFGSGLLIGIFSTLLISSI